jgi:small subunit ribosomal protein S6
MTRDYEIALILNPNMEDSAIDQAIDGVKSLVEREGAKAGDVDKWGKRRLAYPIKSETNGFYAFVGMEAEPSVISTLDSALRLNEQILRHLIVCKDD